MARASASGELVVYLRTFDACRPCGISRLRLQSRRKPMLLLMRINFFAVR